jgi:ABC-type antimicrobial peptide transport system permease subunit
VEDEVAALYRDDRKVALIYSAFTVIAILISVLELFGLSLFDIRQRRREIAIRKVSGASTGTIIRLLLKRYFVLPGIAFAVSIPVALFAIHRYLENFAFKAAVSWWLFPVA